MNLTLDIAQSMISAGWRPMPGRCIIHLDPVPSLIGLIHVPDSAREKRITDIAWTGTVMAVSGILHRHVDPDDEGERVHYWKDTGFSAGDRVILNLYAEDLDHSVIITRNTVILAVLP